MALQLRFRGETSVPVEVEGITPDAVRGLSLTAIERLPIYEGNRQAKLADFFAVSGDAADEQIVWEGSLQGVHWIGAKMRSGSVHVTGSAGRHVGSEMRGGQIVVEGDAGDWVGGEMHGGLIIVRGQAGHLVGAAYRGSARGMTRGVILIAGNAGNEIGHTMRRGLIVVGGQAGDLAGFNMLAGSVLLCGETGIRHGAGMRRGTLAFFGPPPPELLPTFRHACRYQPLALQLLLRQVASLGFPVPAPWYAAEYDLYHGDLLDGGRGEILIRVA